MPPSNDPAAGEAVALIVVDVQQAFDNPRWGKRNNPEAESNIERLLNSWRSTHNPIFHIRHRSDEPGRQFSPGQPGYDVKPEAQSLPEEPVITKTVNSAFIGTDLQARLRSGGITTVVICGITTDHCISTTARMAGNLGFDTTVVSDATATFERLGPDGRHWTATNMHDAALASLHLEFATIQTTDNVIASAPHHHHP